MILIGIVSGGSVEIVDVWVRIIASGRIGIILVVSGSVGVVDVPVGRSQRVLNRLFAEGACGRSRKEDRVRSSAFVAGTTSHDQMSTHALQYPIVSWIVLRRPAIH